MKSFLKNYRQSPRKVRLVADTIRGKKVDEAMTHLQFSTKSAADQILKVLKSAVANAVNLESTTSDKLYVKEISVDKGPTLKRWRARARGSASPINKRTSNIKIELAVKDLPAKAKK